MASGGISLSPAFVVMYVMQYYQMSWEDALHTVQNRRYCISPNGGFLTQIKVKYVINPGPVQTDKLCRNMSQYTKRALLSLQILLDRPVSLAVSGRKTMKAMIPGKLAIFVSMCMALNLH